jgi:hypothetical protein
VSLRHFSKSSPVSTSFVRKRETQREREREREREIEEGDFYERGGEDGVEF